MISERKNDGIARSPEQWFSRANPNDPAKGGAEKTRMIHGRAWVEHARARWAELTNKTMERLGREERVDHRSYVRQGVGDEAGRHFGPAAAHMVGRGQSHDRLEIAANALTDSERLQAIDRAIGDLEIGRQAVLAGEQKRVERESAPGGGTSGGGPTRDQDESRSR
jgi:hypothetical protein